VRALGLRIFRSPACMVGAGLLVRVLAIALTHSYRIAVSYWSGFETSDIAYSLVMRHGFSFVADAGPTAWIAPLYPCILAAIFQLFGVFSQASALAVFTLNSIFAALTSWTIYRIASLIMNKSVACWSGWIWVVVPTSIYFSVFWIWDTTLAAFLLSAVFLLTLELDRDPGVNRWCKYGTVWALIGLSNPSLLLWLPFSGCWILYRLYSRRQLIVKPVLVSALLFWALVSPWLIRNYVVFHQPLLLRSGFGANLRAGNNPNSQGWWDMAYTYNNPDLLKQYVTQGEPAFVTEQGRLARQWVAEHPRRFAWLCVRRIIFFWTGIPHNGSEQWKNLLLAAWSLLSFGGWFLAIKRHVLGHWLITTLLIFYPALYYITFPQPRYRHAIEPELLTLAVFLVCAAAKNLRPGRRLTAQHADGFQEIKTKAASG